MSDYDRDYDHHDRDGPGAKKMWGALPVANHPIGHPSLPPSSGEEYLRRVRAEALSFPDVIEADPTTVAQHRRAAPSNDTHPAADPLLGTDALAPPPTFPRAWAERTIDQYRSLHTKIAVSRAALVEYGPGGIPLSHKRGPPVDVAQILDTLPTRYTMWYRFLYSSRILGGSAPGGCDDLWRPSVLVHFPHAKALQLLDMHTQWIATAARGNRGLMAAVAKTVFCLLVALDPTLTADETFLLRSLGKACCAVREEGFGGGEMEVDVGEGVKAAREDAHAELAVIVLIIAQGFGQRDLCVLK
ncbi:hypothetical protein AMAG_11598 [Allomyces macrogynus ATCC 38327]|uniref:Uncharacterized protein n=1 Tax=Allomyces macrogynus (strain ATCC 38327) TaxID=578462 RepID=A0A0L0SVI9_ALLM3|nr:hypothetical protein AMAG_11598 [Allomyces macrogynus ATCC 38327]|eukprot:KNE66461.1 hypothetical protein AMAG_11598 [Allomyces macrogynus ATCC 38327]